MTPATVVRLMARRREVQEEEREIADWRIGVLLSELLNAFPGRRGRRFEPADFFRLPTREVLSHAAEMPKEMTPQQQAMWALSWRAYYQSGPGSKAFAA